MKFVVRPKGSSLPGLTVEANKRHDAIKAYIKKYNLSPDYNVSSVAVNLSVTKKTRKTPGRKPKLTFEQQWEKEVLD